MNVAWGLWKFRSRVKSSCFSAFSPERTCAAAANAGTWGSEFSAPMSCKGLVAIDCMGDLNIFGEILQQETHLLNRKATIHSPCWGLLLSEARTWSLYKTSGTNRRVDVAPDCRMAAAIMRGILKA